MSEELEKLELYLSLEKLRFKDKLEYEISISTEIDKYSILIPTMILQPYVENAIWHGIMPLETSGKVSISIEPYNKSSLCIIIEDNGIGMPSSQHHTPSELLRKDNHRSSGIKLTEERIQLLSDLSGQTAGVGIDTAHPASLQQPGTKVTIILPLEINAD